MNALRHGLVTSLLLGVLWLMVVATTVSVVLSFATGEAARPALLGCVLLGVVAGLVALLIKQKIVAWVVGLALAIAFVYSPLSPIVLAESVLPSRRLIAGIMLGASTAIPLEYMLRGLVPGKLTRHVFKKQ